METSFFKLIFSDLPLSVAVAFPFIARDGNPTTYAAMWTTIERNFRTKRSNLIAFYHIGSNEFEQNVLKLDFRAK